MHSLPALVHQTIAGHPHPLLFVTISGAHLYCFSSADSDYDIRGAHLLPPERLLGLRKGEETITRMIEGPPEVDLVTHDAEKFFRLLLKPNGYVLEQLYSPLVVLRTPAYEALKEIARGCITRRHVLHYTGFAENQWNLLLKEERPRVKPLLYCFRVLLTGIHLMRTGIVEANLLHLNAGARLPYIEELVARKTSGSEHEELRAGEVAFYESEFRRLMQMLQDEAERSSLPEAPLTREDLHQLLLQARMGAI